MKAQVSEELKKINTLRKTLYLWASASNKEANESFNFNKYLLSY